jgi:hypothetical protein
MNPPELKAGGWRLKLSAALFGLSVVLPMGGVALVAALDLSGTLTASLSGALLLAGEILGVSAVAVAGKSGFAFIKSKVFGLLKQYGPPNKVSRLRYRIGLVMFGTPLLFGWLSVYAAVAIPGFTQNPLPYALSGDLLLLASLFVLGGDFWDKIRSLFIHNAAVRFEQTSD